MKNIDTVINAIVEEGFTATIFFIPILIAVLSIFKLYGLSLILGFLTSVIITTALFAVRVYFRLEGKSLAERNVKEAVLVGVIVSATFTVYTAIYSAITSSNFVCLALAFVTYLMWRYYENLEDSLNLKRVVKSCIILSMFNVALGFIYALKGFSPTLIVWFSCWIGLIVALTFLSSRNSGRGVRK